MACPKEGFMKIDSVSIVTVYCTDQEAARRFYVDILGLAVRADATTPDGIRWLLVGPHSQPELSLMLMEPGEPLDSASAAALRGVLEHGGLSSVTFAVDDCRASIAELEAQGVEVLHAPTQQSFGVEAVVSDGCGNGVVLMERPKPV
jgi:catechol 2,3-dioxygenase-like lactoylglutathione lyase family enzyme